MKAIVIDYAHSSISISSAFAKKAFTPGTEEYRQLIAVRKDFPEFRLVTRKFKANTKQEHYRGLTYDFMREYISTHEKDAERVLAELDNQIDITKCHSLGKRYPTVKAWFLEHYPEIAEFGMATPKQNQEANVSQLPEAEDKVVEAPAA